ncbi:MAG TPA: DEAD/DEAH box helicase, partial [Prosthecobacter sp.]|nr:DEAD/DEAH box helicase [Prosthecobacter sp.]
MKKSFTRLTQAQELTLPHILAGRSVLLSSPTGTGKTLAGFLGVLDHLVRAHEAGTLGSGIQAIYVSPLRALTYDIQKNLSAPLAGMGLDDILRVGLRTGDTTASDRAKLRRKPPHILLTTPESLAI